MNINFRPIGRTGNMMFQAAAALGYAHKHRWSWGCQHNTREVPHFFEMFPNVPRLNGEFTRYNRTDPSKFGYEEMRFKQDTTLVGFFQSIKYFEHCQDAVKEVFKLDINPIDAVSIHVRRGDYVQYSNSFPPVDVKYLNEAIQYVRKNTSPFKVSHKFIFFSDDIDWCKKFVSENWLGTPNEFLFSERKNEFDDLSLMASCSHHIIANSTFSWWGAFLGHNPDKIVVSPHYENWFGPGFTGAAPKDLIPDNWIQIKFR